MPVSRILPPAAPTGSPLTMAYDRLTQVFPGLVVTEATDVTQPLPHGPGWVGARELADGGAAADALTDTVAAQVTADHGRRPRPDVAAALALHRYAWPACLLFTVPWFLSRRVPRLAVTDVSFHRAAGRMTVRPRSFACLPDDPAAALPHARVVPDEAALRDELRAALAEHLAPLLEGFGPRLRRGPRALWGMATDEITEGLWRVGQLLGEEERAAAELAALLPGGTTPYAGGAAFRELTVPTGTDAPSPPVSRTRDRLTCCRFYTISPADACTTCPRTCDADRIRRLVSAA
ncbi:(2Fe-2S)-binding protein [Streptomyces sp. NPDC008079]|uniref:(2Fe-2S)-binding protein n=1 Tax=Streptomyces sp. NPDC008079 TaxID=3364806 RepID=UPI0036E89505